MSLFRTILIIAISYYLFKFILKFYLRIRSANFGRNQNKPQSKGKANKEKKGEDELGKYIDYEDVND